MKIEKGLNPNCSEAVFRFYTLEPKKIQQILQIISDKVSSAYGDKEKRQIIPLFKTAEQYDTGWNKELSYSGKEREKYDKEIAQIWNDRDNEIITQEQAMKKYRKIQKKIDDVIYPNTLITACAGLGDNNAVVTIEKGKKAFRLNIGNNDISDGIDWVNYIKSMRIKVEEAGACKDLEEHARDCTCGIIFGF